MAAPPRPYGLGPYGVGPYSVYADSGAGNIWTIGGAATLTFGTAGSVALRAAVNGRSALVFAVRGYLGITRITWGRTGIVFGASLALTYAWPRLDPCEGGTWSPLAPSTGTWTPVGACSTGTWKRAA